MCDGDKKMRTTIQLDDELHEIARKYALEKGKTFTRIVEESLREKLLSRPAGHKVAPVVLPTVDGDGIRPGVDLDDSAALLELMQNG